MGGNLTKKTSFLEKRADGGGCKVVGLIINMVVKPSRDVTLAIANVIYDNPDFELRIFYGSPATTVDNLVAFAKSGLAGMVICGFGRETVISFLRAMPEHPPVLIGLYSPPTEQQLRVIGNGGVLVLDNDLIGKTAAEFFLRHGLQNFAFVGTNIYREGLSAEIRCRAFWKRLAESGHVDIANIMLGERLPNDDFWIPELESVGKWLERRTFPCGIFVNGEIEAYALTKMCRKLGLDVPKDMEILCIDNSYGFCEDASPTLSRIRIRLDAVSKQVAEMLDGLVNGRLPQERRVVFISESALELVERGSTAGGRGYGRIAGNAKEFIRIHACEGIDVPDVATHLGVSRRSLERRVKEATGQSVASLIRSVRLSEVCRLLKTTDMSISDVTEKAGYHITSNLSILFKREFGVTMREYRARNRVL